jgi:hypothetical protein
LIDKLDLRIPRNTWFRQAVSGFTRAVNYSSNTQNIRPAPHYAGKADLRPIGIDALLFLSCKSTDERNHKLEILDVGKKSYSEIVQLIGQVAEADPRDWGVMRVDLTADVWDIPVSWARENVRFKFKRTEREYGEIKYGLIGRGKVETITAGSRPNVFRIYDKVAESKVQFRKLLKQRSPDSSLPEFEKEFGFKERDTVTRFERQCGGKLIPVELGTFGDLQRAPDFNPFQNLEILSSGKSSLPTPEECDGMEYYTGIGLREERQKLGLQSFRKQLNRQTNGNAARTMQRYERFFVDEKPRSFFRRRALQ